MKSKGTKLKRLALAFALVACVATAQDKTATKDAAKPEMMEPQPGPEMTKLNFLLGTWNVDGEYAKSSILPQGGKALGWYKAQLGPGGFSIVADFEAESPMGKEIGHQVLTWDPPKRVYTVVTVGNFPGAIIGRAHWDGDDLVTESEFEFGGMKMSNRTVYSKVRENAIHIEESGKIGDGAFEPWYRANTVKK